MFEYGWPECRSAIGLNLICFGIEKIPHATTRCGTSYGKIPYTFGRITGS